MANKKPTPDTFASRMTRLQDIVTALEDEALPLEDGLLLYKEGLLLSRTCREQLEKAKIEVRTLAETSTDAEDTLASQGERS